MGHLIKPMNIYDVKVFRTHPDAILPTKKQDEDAGYDLYALEDFTIYPGERVVVRTGLVIQPPPGHHTEILLRSSMAYKHNIMLINGVGLIDRSYSGPEDELKIMLYAAPLLTGNSFYRPSEVGFHYYHCIKFKKGDRIAQLVFRKTEVFSIVEVDEAPGLTRGGFGSTGV